MHAPLPIAKLVLAYVCACFALSSALAQTPRSHQHGFRDAERWAQVFDDPARDAWQKPDEVIRALALKPDAVVADIGAGTGYFAVRLARAVPQGRVYGVDIESDMVGYVAKRAKHEGLANLRVVQGAPDDPRLPEKVDLVLLVDTYHHIEGREDYFGGLRRSLRPDARVAIVDFRLDSPVGPPRNVRIAPERVARELQSAGYTLAQEHRFLPYQYLLVFRVGG